MKKVKKILIMSLTILILRNSFSYSISSNLNKQKEDLDKQIEETNSEIAGVKSQMTTTLNQIVKLNSEISNLENDIDNLNISISEKNAKLEEQETKYEIQKELLKSRLIALYESGETTYLDMLLSSENLSDFISNYYLISELAKADEELLNNIQTAKEQIKNDKLTLENEKIQIENKKSQLSNSKSSKENLVSNLSQEESELEKKLEEMEEDRKLIQKEISELVAKEMSNNSNVSPSAYGYIFPVLGCTKSNINNLSYPSYIGHTGIDININVTGKSVVAVKDGTVAISKAARNSDGTYRSYGEYIVINHHDGTMTLYAHMLSGSRKFSKNEEVKQGQTIGIVGSTGNSTGTHLHFEVMKNGKIVNPIPYLP